MNHSSKIRDLYSVVDFRKAGKWKKMSHFHLKFYIVDIVDEWGCNSILNPLNPNIFIKKYISKRRQFIFWTFLTIEENLTLYNFSVQGQRIYEGHFQNGTTRFQPLYTTIFYSKKKTKFLVDIVLWLTPLALKLSTWFMYGPLGELWNAPRFTCSPP